jgi:flagellar hook-length control protein FliK
MAANAMEAAAELPALQPAGAPVPSELTPARLDTPLVAASTESALPQSAGSATEVAQAGTAKSERQRRTAEPEPHERPRAHVAATEIASQTTGSRTATDASPEPSAHPGTTVSEASPADRNVSDPGPPRLPDAATPPSPAQVRGPTVADPLPAVQPPVASHPVALPSPDHRGRVVSARLVVAQDNGGSSMRIDLEPADLGRVEVALHVDDAGLASATFTVDRPETLQLLQRDARSVGELLGAAGFTVQQGALGFTLRDPPGGQHGSERGERGGRAVSARDGPATPARPFARRDGLLDLRV